jgi:hypothetical protein
MDSTNAERQARHRAKERDRWLALEREVQVLRNTTPEQVQQLARENEALRERVRQLEQTLHNGSVEQRTSAPDRSEPAELTDFAWRRDKRYTAFAEFCQTSEEYEETVAAVFRDVAIALLVRRGWKRDEIAHLLDQLAAEELKDLAEAIATARRTKRERKGENGSDERGAAGEVARAPEAADR